MPKIMLHDPLKIPQLKQQFSKVNYFTAEDLRAFYNSFKVLVSDETFRSRIYRLAKMGVLQRKGQGIYSLGTQPVFVSDINTQTKKIYETIHKQYPYAKTSIWHTITLNQFMIHQPFKYNFIVEVEKDAAESVFYFLQEKFKNVYLNPEESTFAKYISGTSDSIIVKNLISESPIHDINGVMTPTIEKILVDIFCDKTIYTAFQGKEMQNIFRNAFKEYDVKLSTLSRYAVRRGKKEEIDAYLRKLELGVKNKPM